MKEEEDVVEEDNCHLVNLQVNDSLPLHLKVETFRQNKKA